MSLQQVQQRFESFEAVEFAGPASEADVAELRRLFRKAVPADYLEFLQSLGAGAVESEEFVGLGGPVHLDARRVTARLRESSEFAEFGDHLVPLSGDGGGNYECIDLDRSSPTTAIIVAWDHGRPTDDELPVLATGYWEWFLGMLDLIDGLGEPAA
jgi:hypothetical protein